MWACHVCKIGDAKHRCPRCGRFTCSTCYNAAAGSCVPCARLVVNLTPRDPADSPVALRSSMEPNRTALCVLAFLFPLGGYIAGLYHLTKDEDLPRKAGRAAILWATIGLLVWGLVITAGPPLFVAAYWGLQGASEPAAVSSSDLAVQDWQFDNSGYYSEITGSLKNNTDRQYSYAQVEFNLYDGTGTQVGSTIANVNNLEPGGVWQFRATVLERNARTAKLKGVSGW